MSRHQHLYKERPLEEALQDVVLAPELARYAPPVSRIYSAANIITALRLGLVPLIIYALLTDHFLFALSGFVLAALSDALDGLLARTLSLRTQLGAILDPLADKCLLMSTFAAFAFIEEVPLWLVASIITRDILIMVAAGWVLLRGVTTSIRPVFISKINTFFELTLACLVLCRLADLFYLPLIEESFYAIVIMTLLLSTLHYARLGIHFFRGR
jgi:cardiolipin synthase